MRRLRDNNLNFNAPALMFALALIAMPASAADILVTSTDDNTTANDCLCTLREAAANAATDSDTTSGDCPAGSGADTIFVPAGTYTAPSLDFDGPAGGGLTTVVGDGVDVTILQVPALTDGIEARVATEVRGLTLDCQGLAGSGAQVYGSGNLTFGQVRVTGCEQAIVTGSSGDVRVEGSTFDNNAPRLDLSWYGVITSTDVGFVSIVNSTFSGNAGSAYGQNIGTGEITGTTITGNSGDWAVSSRPTIAATPIEVSNSIIAGNSNAALAEGNCDSKWFDSLGYNIFGQSNQSGFSSGCLLGLESTDTVPTGAISEVLDTALAANGGQTATHALVGSLAIDFVPSGANGCGTDPLDLDQRGATRFSGSGCDAGSYEEIGAVPATDTDGDGVADATDNCPFTANPPQADTGGVGGRGDACDPGYTPGCEPPCNDGDGDGYGDPGDATCSSGSALQDCDDADDTIYPGATELCDGVDNNCDAAIDEGFDADADGYTTCGGDCDDGNDAVNPGAAEVCDGADNNCDAAIDEGLPDDDSDGVCDALDACPGLDDAADVNGNATADCLDACGGAAFGQSPTSILCYNQTQRRHKSPAAGTPWDCEAAGMPVTTGDSVAIYAYGDANNPPAIGGGVTGMSSVDYVRCTNRSTGQRVYPALASPWDCEAAGLVVGVGDRLRMTVVGTAN